MKIRTRLRIGVALVVLVLVVTAIVVALTFQQVRIAQREHNAMLSVVEGLFELNMLTYDYAMHPGERARLQWSAKHAAIGEVLERLDCASPSHRADSEKMRNDHKSIGELFARLVGHEAGDAGREGKAYEQARNTLVTQFLMRSHEMNGVVSRLLRQSEDEVASIWQRFSWVMTASMMIIASVMIGVSSWTSRSVGRPVSQLRKGAEIIGTGDLDFRVGTDATDEIGELSRAFDRMTGSLRESVTERKRAGEALVKSEAHYRTLVEGLPHKIFVKDRNSVYISVNAAYAADFGRAQEDFSGKDDYEFYPRELADKYRADDRAVIESGQAQDIEETYVVEGKRFFVQTVKAPVKDDRGDVVGVLGVFRDITERKELEQQLRQAQKMESIGLLAGGVAHDFNNILVGIKGCAGFALETTEPGSQAHEDLTEVLAQANRAADLTRQLLAFSRRQTLEPVALNVNVLIADQANMLTRLIGENIELQFLPASDLGNVRADPGQIEQVIMNLAVNARDVMPDGGRLTIETANVELGEEYARNHADATAGPYVMMAISDTGCGMDAETRSRIFDPFFTTKELGKGTGLGLSTAYGIVKQHGGNIWVYSEEGKGTTFKVYLPRVAAEAEEREPKSEFTVGGAETILLAEDDNAVRTVGRRHLEALGYTVLCAANAREAEEIAQEHEGRIDLLLTDVVMPDRNGRELYKTLAANQAGLKVLYMSGYTDNAIVHHGVLEEGIAFLQKPFEREDLAAKVRDVLDG